MSELRIREAVRAVVVDDDDRVLLVRFEFPAGTRWALPGGGLDPGESDRDGLRRELTEEIGLHDAVIGPHLWNRLHIIPFIDGRYDGQREKIFLVRVPSGFEPRPEFTWDQLHAEYVFEMRWWTPAEMDAADVVFVPAELPALFARLRTDGPPATPLDVDV
jgi:8-oxo-dGTP diphosphatase